MKVFVATWNMNNLKDSGGDSLEDLLGIGHREHDIFVVGTQEFGSTLSVWRDLLLKAAGSSHTLLHAQQLEGIKMVIIIRKSLRRYAHSIESAEIATKLGGLIKTKGGVGIAFKLGPTSFLFINSHLAAHQTKVADRYALIVDGFMCVVGGACARVGVIPMISMTYTLHCLLAASYCSRRSLPAASIFKGMRTTTTSVKGLDCL